METFIISFVVIILLVLAMSLILKNTVKTIDDKSKSYFVDKLKQYDYLIDEKEKKLSELEEELEKRNNEIYKEYHAGKSVDTISKERYLSKSSIYRILKQVECM